MHPQKFDVAAALGQGFSTTAQNPCTRTRLDMTVK
jgi:hypothetical protein